MAETYDLALLMCPPWDTEKPPLNIALLAEFMRANGMRVWVKDLNIDFYNRVHSKRWSAQKGQGSAKTLAMLWEMMSQNWIEPVRMTDVFFDNAQDEIEQEVNELLNTGAKFIGLSIHYRNVFFANRLASMIRERDPERVIIFGGPQVSADYRTNKLDELDADVLVVGEGEHTLLDFIKANAYKHVKHELEPVSGAILHVDGHYTPYDFRPLIADLDTIPFPTYSDFDVFSYHPEPMPPRLPFLSSRGCVGKCSFCMDHYITGRFRHRSAENAIAELKYHIDRYKIYDFSFNDLLCNGNPKALGRLAQKIIDEDLKINWWSYAMIHKGMAYDLFKLLKRSGCANIDFGLEAASNKVLQLMNKFYTADVAEQVIRDCARAGIMTSINIIVGFPQETWDDFLETVEFVKRNSDYITTVINVGTLMLSPGSDVASCPEKFGVKFDYEKWSWYDNAGNTLEGRNEKLEYMLNILKDLRIPVEIINRELPPQKSEKPSPQQPERLEQRDRIVPIKIINVQIMNQVWAVYYELFPMEQMAIAIQFESSNFIDNPIFQASIYGYLDSGERIPIFGTNTARFNIDFKKMGPGEGEIQLLIYNLALAPGEYELEVGIWESEGDIEPLAQLEKPIPFTVIANELAEKQFEGVKSPLFVHKSTAIQHISDEASSNKIVSTKMLDFREMESISFRTNLNLTLICEVELENADNVVFSQSIINKNRVVYRHDIDKGLSNGVNRIVVEYNPLRFLEGEYVMDVKLIDKNTKKVIDSTSQNFVVRSRRMEGSGLLFMPCTWNLKRVP